MNVSLLRNDWVIALASAVIVYLYFIVVPPIEGWQISAALLAGGSALLLFPTSRNAWALASMAEDAADKAALRFAGHATGKIAWVIVPTVLVAQPETLFIYLPLFLACSLFVPTALSGPATAIRPKATTPWSRYFLNGGVAVGIVVAIAMSITDNTGAEGMRKAIWVLIFIPFIAALSVVTQSRGAKASPEELAKIAVGILAFIAARFIS